MAAARVLQRLVGSSVDEGPSPNMNASGSSELSTSTDSDQDLEPGTAGLGDAPEPKYYFEGAQLFELFVFDQISKNKVASHALKDLIMKPASYTREVCDKAAMLCDMAVTFAQSEDRQKVKDAAMTVSSCMIRQELTNVLRATLEEAANLDEGVVVLFFFCLDLSVRLLETEHREALAVINWCKNAIDIVLEPYGLAPGGWVRLPLEILL